MEAEVSSARDPESVLTAALEQGARVTHFEIADPSLEQILIEHVGAIVQTERTLAAPKLAGVAA